MPAKKAFALRTSPAVLEAMQRWADDDLRSLNAQIEFVLRAALQRAGRLKTTPSPPVDDEENENGK
ncbi:MAG: Arc family DNA binding domain-containing protein [Gammaproteobacteria bacterium]